MVRKILKNNKGFTLVEVIVVAVIVAVLSLVGIQLYQGYVQDSRNNTAENLAASAATFLQTAENVIGDTATTTLCAKPLGSDSTSVGSWTYQTPSGENVTFSCPANAQVKVAGSAVKATITGGGESKNTHNYK